MLCFLWFCGLPETVFTHSKHLFDRGKSVFFFFFFFLGGGGYIFLCIPPCSLNFRYFGVKSTVPMNSNLRDSTVGPTS